MLMYSPTQYGFVKMIQPRHEIAQHALQRQADADADHPDARNERCHRHAKLVQHHRRERQHEQRVNQRLQIVPAEPGRVTSQPRGSKIVVTPERPFLKQFREANDGKTEITLQPEEGPSLAADWLDSMRARRRPVYDVLRGYQVLVAIKLGVDSYRSGKVMAFDPTARALLREAPPHPEYKPAGA